MSFPSFSLVEKLDNGWDKWWVWLYANTFGSFLWNEDGLPSEIFTSQRINDYPRKHRKTPASLYPCKINTASCKKNTLTIYRLYKMDSRTYSFNTILNETFVSPTLGEITVWWWCSMLFKNRKKKKKSPQEVTPEVVSLPGANQHLSLYRNVCFFLPLYQLCLTAHKHLFKTLKFGSVPPGRLIQLRRKATVSQLTYICWPPRLG